MRRGGALALLAAALLCGCGPDLAGVSWPSFKREPGYALPKTSHLVVFRSKHAEAADDGGFVSTTALVVQDDLRKQGIETEIVEARGHEEPGPFIGLAFLGFDEGSEAGREAAGPAGLAGGLLLLPVIAPAASVASGADIDVTCTVVDDHGKVLLSARARGQGKSPRNEAEALGHAIAKALLDVHYPPPDQYEAPP